MALLHQADLRPAKLELLTAWLPTRSWYQGPLRIPQVPTPMATARPASRSHQARRLAEAAGATRPTAPAGEVAGTTPSPSPISITLFLSSVLAPAFAVLGVWSAAFARSGVSGFVRLHAMAVSSAVLIFAACLAAYGMVGLRTWAI